MYYKQLNGDIMIRLAVKQDKNAVNSIRKQVHALHASARPDMFRSEFSDELANRFDFFLQSDEYEVAVCDNGGAIAGFVTMKHVAMSESPYAVERRFLLVEELGVDFKSRRKGIGSQLMCYVKDYAKSLGYTRIQLDMWAFNETAEEFYLDQGFETYRKYMEIHL